eukprot:692140-Rhodomonas_salina.3
MDGSPRREVSYAICLRACYAKSGTGLGHAPARTSSRLAFLVLKRCYDATALWYQGPSSDESHLVLEISPSASIDARNVNNALRLLVQNSATFLHASYAMSGTDVAYHVARITASSSWHTALVQPPLCPTCYVLRACYAMSGAHLCYAATRRVQIRAVLSY